MDDDATIATLKLQIEQFVNVPADKQVIRTFNTSFTSCRKVKDLCDDRGASIMLFALNDVNENPQFVCFLHIITNESRFQLEEMELQHSATKASMLAANSNASSSSGTLLVIHETDSSESESLSEESDSNGSLYNTLSSSAGKKRKMCSKQCVEQKRYACVCIGIL